MGSFFSLVVGDGRGRFATRKRSGEIADETALRTDGFDPHRMVLPQ